MLEEQNKASGAPASEAERPALKIGDETTLEQLPVGATGHIVAALGEGRIRRRIFDMGLTPGCEVFVRKRAPLGDPVELTLRGYELTLRKSEAAIVKVRVSELPAADAPTEK